MQRSPHFHGLVAGSVLLALASVADAQALFLARRAIGRIEQMSQSSPTTGAAYDVATVIVEVTAREPARGGQKVPRSVEALPRSWEHTRLPCRPSGERRPGRRRGVLESPKTGAVREQLDRCARIS